jgi:hypothetical protein
MGDQKTGTPLTSGEILNDHALFLTWDSMQGAPTPYMNLIWNTNSWGSARSYPGPGLVIDWAKIDLERGEALDGMWFREGTLLYSTHSTGASLPWHTLYSLPLRNIYGGAGGSRTVISMSSGMGTRTEAEIIAENRYVPDNFYTGPTMVAYYYGSELHARTYDGTVDVVLNTTPEELQNGFYNPRAYEAARGLP